MPRPPPQGQSPRRGRDARLRRKTERGSLSPSGLERKAPRSVWATPLPASRPIRWIVRESREANRTDFATYPARPRTDSPALGRPTPIQPFPNPDMDGINRHPTTSQPSFGSNTRTTRFRLNLPTSLIRQLQPILKNNSTSTKKLAQDRPFRVLCKRSLCRASSTQISRSRVTFVILPATPCPVPSKKRQRFISAAMLACHFHRVSGVAFHLLIYETLMLIQRQQTRCRTSVAMGIS